MGNLFEEIYAFVFSSKIAILTILVECNTIKIIRFHTRSPNIMTRSKAKPSILNKLMPDKEIEVEINNMLSTLKMSDLNHGRTNDEMKTILNYIMTAMYHKNKTNQYFNALDFFNQVKNNLHKTSLETAAHYQELKLFFKISSSLNTILPNGLFDGDLVLSKEQTFAILSKYLKHTSFNSKRKTLKDLQHRWPLPIYYVFDGSHG
jgi:hypothetical protein